MQKLVFLQVNFLTFYRMRQLLLSSTWSIHIGNGMALTTQIGANIQIMASYHAMPPAELQ